MKEPQALNTLIDESDKLKAQTRKLLPETIPAGIEFIFGDWSDYFTDQILCQWRENKRFDELVDYLIYQYDEFDGHKPWNQVLLDLRLNNKKSLAIRLLEGLLKKREKKLATTLAKLKNEPDNLNVQVALTIHKASVLSLLAEIEVLLLMEPVGEADKVQHGKLREKIQKIQNY